MRRGIVVGLLAVWWCLGAAEVARAQTLPAVNLGYTTFKDGGYPAGTGTYFSQYMQYYDSGRFHNVNGAIANPTPSIDAWVSLTQLLFYWDYQLPFGAKPGLNLLLPAAGINEGPAIAGTPRAYAGGIGDFLIGPELQFNMINDACGNPLFVHRLEFEFFLPTGNYSAGRNLNVGSGAFYFDPYWAATFFPTPKVNVSWRLHYLWCAKNNDPPVAPGLNSNQPGQAFHFNYAIGYDLTPKLTAGVTGYYLIQTTDDRQNGVGMPGTREELFGVGPGIMYQFDKDGRRLLEASVYFEPIARNHFEGTNVVLRYIHKF